jgi:queuine/archaeosine tRNA-ribosyltransferase
MTHCDESHRRPWLRIFSYHPVDRVYECMQRLRKSLGRDSFKNLLERRLERWPLVANRES